MGKKNRVPESEKSAFDRAKAAFDRVGEDYIPASKAVELSKAEEPAEATPETSVDDNAATTETSVDDNAATTEMSVDNNAATPETSVDAPDTDNAPTSDEPAETSDTDAAATPDEPADSDADSADTSNAESVEPETDADVSEPADSAETPEASVETPEASAETSETPVSEAADAPEASEPAESETPVDSGATPEEPISEAPEISEVSEIVDDSEQQSETVDDSATPEPEAVEVAEEETDEADDFWTFDADEPESEVTEMEKLTMETKEITLGVHRSSPAHADTQPREQERKPKFRFKAFDQLKDTFRTHADSAEHAEQSDDNPPSSGGSSRDAAIRKRVMQIDDEETRNYLLDRVLPQMTWYSKKSAQYQTMYYRLMAATILMGALIPAFSVGANHTVVKVILALLGASVTGINAYLALHNYHDLWITYRTTREDLIHHLYCYFNKAGVFSSSENAEDLNVLLVNICEDTLSKENGGWTTIVQKT